MARPRIAIVEDETALVDVLQYNLERGGFEVVTFTRGDEAWEGLRASPPDLVLLDLMLPGLDGLELARLLKREAATSQVPVLMLTARSEEVDRIVGLELGADDYITKPFSPREVMLRIKAVLRRTRQRAPAGEPPRWLEAGGIRLSPDGHQAFVGDAEIGLTPTEFRLLHLLLDRQGRTQTRSTLLSDVWGYSEDVDSRTVDTHIRRLRKKLGPEAERVETVIGVGYRLRR
ncbi:MAG TPA: response regulator [Thermoanaerobaculia bacterium]|nr:response regulator [Thermoanaerobaculia bacterium]